MRLRVGQETPRLMGKVIRGINSQASLIFFSRRRQPAAWTPFGMLAGATGSRRLQGDGITWRQIERRSVNR